MGKKMNFQHDGSMAIFEAYNGWVEAGDLKMDELEQEYFYLLCSHLNWLHIKFFFIFVLVMLSSAGDTLGFLLASSPPAQSQLRLCLTY